MLSLLILKYFNHNGHHIASTWTVKLQKTAGGTILFYSQNLNASQEILEIPTCNISLSQTILWYHIGQRTLQNVFPSSSFPLQSCRCTLQLLQTYFDGPTELKISLRLSSEIPFPRKTLTPSNSLAPLLHFPSISEYTETRSPAFIAA